MKVNNRSAKPTIKNQLENTFAEWDQIQSTDQYEHIKNIQSKKQPLESLNTMEDFVKMHINVYNPPHQQAKIQITSETSKEEPVKNTANKFSDFENLPKDHGINPPKTQSINDSTDNIHQISKSNTPKAKTDFPAQGKPYNKYSHIFYDGFSKRLIDKKTITNKQTQDQTKIENNDEMCEEPSQANPSNRSSEKILTYDLAKPSLKLPNKFSARYIENCDRKERFNTDRSLVKNDNMVSGIFLDKCFSQKQTAKNNDQCFFDNTILIEDLQQIKGKSLFGNSGTLQRDNSTSGIYVKHGSIPKINLDKINLDNDSVTYPKAVQHKNHIKNPEDASKKTDIVKKTLTLRDRILQEPVNVTIERLPITNIQLKTDRKRPLPVKMEKAEMVRHQIHQLQERSLKALQQSKTVKKNTDKTAPVIGLSQINQSTSYNNCDLNSNFGTLLVDNNNYHKYVAQENSCIDYNSGINQKIFPQLPQIKVESTPIIHKHKKQGPLKSNDTIEKVPQKPTIKSETVMNINYPNLTKEVIDMLPEYYKNSASSNFERGATNSKNTMKSNGNINNNIENVLWKKDCRESCLMINNSDQNIIKNEQSFRSKVFMKQKSYEKIYITENLSEVDKDHNFDEKDKSHEKVCESDVIPQSRLHKNFNTQSQNTQEFRSKKFESMRKNQKKVKNTMFFSKRINENDEQQTPKDMSPSPRDRSKSSNNKLINFMGNSGKRQTYLANEINLIGQAGNIKDVIDKKLLANGNCNSTHDLTNINAIISPNFQMREVMEKLNKLGYGRKKDTGGVNLPSMRIKNACKKMESGVLGKYYLFN